MEQAYKEEAHQGWPVATPTYEYGAGVQDRCLCPQEAVKCNGLGSAVDIAAPNVGCWKRTHVVSRNKYKCLRPYWYREKEREREKGNAQPVETEYTLYFALYCCLVSQQDLFLMGNAEVCCVTICHSGIATRFVIQAQDFTQELLQDLSLKNCCTIYHSGIATRFVTQERATNPVEIVPFCIL